MSSSSCCPVCYRGSDIKLNVTGYDPVTVSGIQKRFFQFLERYLVTGGIPGLGEKLGARDKGIKSFPFPLQHFTAIGMVSCRDCLTIMETFCQLFHQLKATELLLDWQLQKLKGIMVGSQRVSSRIKYLREFIGNLSDEALDCRWKDVEEITSCIVKSKKLLIAKCSTKTSNSFPILEMTKCDVANKALPCVQIPSHDLIESMATSVDTEEESNISNLISNVNYDDSYPAPVGTSEPIIETPNDDINIIEESIEENGNLLSDDNNVNLALSGDATAARVNPKETRYPYPGQGPTTSRIFLEPAEEAKYMGQGGRNIISSDNYPSVVASSNNGEMEVDLDGDTVVEEDLQIVKNEADERTNMVDSDSLKPFPSLDTVLSTSPLIINIPGVSNPTENQERRSSLRAKYRCEHCAKTFPLLQRLQLHLQECQNQDNSDQDEDDTTSAIYSNMDNDDSDNLSLFSSTSEEEGELHPEFGNKYTAISTNRKLDVRPACALDITTCQKQPTPEPIKLSLKCPDCDDLHQTFKSFLIHRKDSESCRALYDPAVSVTVDVLGPALDNQTDLDESKPVLTQFAIIELSQAIFICGDCGLALYCPEDLEKHIELHGNFPCQFCDLKFTYAPELSLHELEHSKVRKSNRGSLRRCPRCDVGYPSKQITTAYLRHHLRVHLSLTLNEPSCAICKTTAKYLGSSGLAEHIKSHHNLTNNNTPEKCPMTNCGAYYLNKDQLQEHLKVCHAQVSERDKRGMHKCKDCGRSFYMMKNLRQHRLKYHSGSSLTNVVKCTADKRPRLFNSHKDLDIHIRRSHPCSINSGHIMKLKCPDCNLLFPDIREILFHRNDPDECVPPPQDPATIIRVEVICTPGNENSLEELTQKTIFAVVDLPQEIYICEICDLATFSIPDGEAHRKLHGSFKCNFCPMTLTYAPDIAKHEKKHTDRTKHGVPKGIKCPQCDLKWKGTGTTSGTIYLHHYLKAHMSLTLNYTECAICKAGPIHHHAPFHLAQHLKRFHDLTKSTQSSVEKIRCTETNCNAYFLTKMQLRSHLKLRHDIDLEKEKRKHKCKDCENCYISAQALRSHRLAYHVESDKVIPCVFGNCCVVFETKEDLISHIMAGTSLNYHKPLDHSQSIKYVQCPSCDALFNGSDPRFLVEHMQSKHGEEKATHVCEFCGKIFKHKDNLERHYLSHSGPESWKFECSVCSRKCINKQKLEEHMRTHTQEKPFVCEICGQKYAHRHNLGIHVNNKHGDEVENIPRKTKSSLALGKMIKRKKTEVKTGEESSSDSDAM